MFLKWHVYQHRKVMAILSTWIAANEKWLLEFTFWQPGRISSPSPATVPSMACGRFIMMLWVFFFTLFSEERWPIKWILLLASFPYNLCLPRVILLRDSLSFRNKDFSSIMVNLALFLEKMCELSDSKNKGWTGFSKTYFFYKTKHDWGWRWG